MVAKGSINPEPMEDYTYLQDFDEADDALSLCDLPLYNDATEWEDSSEDYHRPSSSDQEFFEFSSDFSGEMNMIIPPNDIIFCGKPIPYKESISEANKEDRTRTCTKESFFRRRSESIKELKSSMSMKNSPSSDKQLRKLSFPKTSMAPENCSYSNKCFRKAEKEATLSSSTKPRWNLLMFGLVKFPLEMELKDIRNRQIRRTSTSLFPAFDDGKSVNSLRSGRKGSFSGLLRALGCKGHGNTMVEASFVCIPYV